MLVASDFVVHTTQNYNSFDGGEAVRPRQSVLANSEPLTEEKLYVPASDLANSWTIDGGEAVRPCQRPG